MVYHHAWLIIMRCSSPCTICHHARWVPSSLIILYKAHFHNGVHSLVKYNIIFANVIFHCQSFLYFLFVTVVHPAGLRFTAVGPHPLFIFTFVTFIPYLHSFTIVACYIYNSFHHSCCLTYSYMIRSSSLMHDSNLI
jgi:hypothetical protein